ncbi:MAG: hypothetical protein Kow00121_48670 [Elainellaceae cyanobacterium]
MYQAPFWSGRSLWRSSPSFAITVLLASLEFLTLVTLVSPPGHSSPFPTDGTSLEVSGSEDLPAPDESLSQTSTDVPPSTMMSLPIQLDPLDSPYPVPWSWVMTMLSERGSVPNPRLRYYRTQSLISPDGQYAAYSRIQMQLASEFTQSRVASVLFLENLTTGDLQTITATSPFADNPFVANAPANQAGTIAILIPVAWSETGDRILAREFESIFGSDLASDFAVVWDRRTRSTHTIAPTQVQYSNAVLLGWSQSHPGQVLFRAGMMGDENWSLYAVDVGGQTAYASNDQPVTFGQIVNSIWSGPQAYLQP